jgi:hypothetical protein
MASNYRNPRAETRNQTLNQAASQRESVPFWIIKIFRRTLTIA